MQDGDQLGDCCHNPSKTLQTIEFGNNDRSHTQQGVAKKKKKSRPAFLLVLNLFIHQLKKNNKSLFLIINLLSLIKISRRGCTFQTSLPRTHTKHYISRHDSVRLHTGVSKNSMWNVLCSFLFYFISDNYSCPPLNCSQDTIVSWDLQFEEQRIRLRAAMGSESETEMGSSSGTLYPKSPVILNK